MRQSSRALLWAFALGALWLSAAAVADDSSSPSGLDTVNQPSTTRTVPAPRPGPDELEGSVYESFPYKLGILAGATFLKVTSITFGAQFGYSLWLQNLYLGPELNFAWSNSGSLFNTLLGGWYEIPIPGSGGMAISFGGEGGIGFATGLAGIRSISPVGFLDLAISQQIDDLASARGHFRPGIVDGTFAFLMSLDVVFRFF